MTVKAVFDFLKGKFPVETACDFDNVGLLIGDPNNTVKRVLIALDCSKSVSEDAISGGYDLVITHHPVIFDRLKSVTASSPVYKLIRSNISVISMHTNLDVGADGVNDCLCNVLELANVESVAAEDGYILKKGNVNPQTAESLAEYLKIRLGGMVKYNLSDQIIRNVLVCSGSGGNFLNEVLPNGCQAFITADVKHNVFLDAERMNISVFDAGHYNTEDVVIEPLAQTLEQEFSDVTFHTTHITKIRSI